VRCAKCDVGRADVGRGGKIHQNKSGGISYFRFVKTLILVILAMSFTAELTAQVIFRNDIVINRKEKRLFNLGITTITINLGRYPNWNQLINGRGGRTMVVDVRALRRRDVTYYNYSELADRIYVPANFTPPVTQPVPLFLLAGRKSLQYPFAEYKGLGLIEKPMVKFR
jgi:hypothetical protein